MKSRFAVMMFVAVVALAQSQASSAGKSSVSPSLGLDTGEKAPEFTARDQFGGDQSNETLKGSNGTVLLFFRSADW